MAGQMGGKRVTQVGLVVHDVDAERNLLLVKGAVPGPKNGDRRDQGGEGPWPRPKAPLLDAAGKASKDVTLEDAVFGAEVKPHLVHETVRAELNARPRGHPRREEPRARLRRPREAVAPEGHRPRPRGHDPRAAVHGRRRRVPADDAQLRGQGQPQGAPRGAPLGAVASTPRTGRSALVDGVGVRDAVDEPGAALTRGVGQGDAARRSSPPRTRTALIKSFRNLERVASSTPASSRSRRSSGRARCSSPGRARPSSALPEARGGAS